MASGSAVADVGLIGLAVMGENLALNMADHGYKVAVYNRTTDVMKKFIARENPPGGLVGCETLQEFVAAIKKPRKIIILVKAGGAVDAVTKQLLKRAWSRTTSWWTAATRCGRTRFGARRNMPRSVNSSVRAFRAARWGRGSGRR
jgi:hypothetical protein